MASADPEPADDAERAVLANVAEHGCHVWLIREEPGQPPFAYSVGIQHTCGAPELLVYGLRPDLLQFMVNEYLDRVRNGERFEPGRDYDGFLGGGHRVRFERVSTEHYTEYFGWDRWFYGGDGFDVLQLVWPSTFGPFPCDDDATDDFRARQPVLFRCGCAPDRHPTPGPDPDAVEGRARLCRHVFDGSRPVLLVVRDRDAPDDFDLLCGGDDHRDEHCHCVHLHHLVDDDPTLRAVLDLEPGHEAERDAVGGTWRRRSTEC